MNENLQALYDSLKGEYDLGTPEEFFAYLQDGGNRKVFYEQIIQPQYDVDNQDVFEQTYGLKKKDEQVSVGVEEDTDLLVPSEKERDFLLEQVSEQERIEAEDPFIGTLLSDTPTDAFEQSAESITPELIGREEKFTVPKLNYQFNDYGFTFEEAGIGVDAMRVTAMNGKQIRIDLDPFTGKGERDEAAKLRKFMDDNRGESERIAKQNKLIRSNIKKVATQEQLDNTISTFNNQTKELREDQKFFVQAKLESDKIYEDNFKDITSEQIANDPALKNAYNSWLEGRKAMEMAYNDLVTKEESIIEKGAELDRIASEYTGMKAKQGTWSGGIIDGLMRGFGKTAAATVSMAATTGVELGIGENVEKKQERIIDEAIEYLETEGGDLDMEELRSNMSGMTMNELEDYLTDIPTNQVKPKTETRMTSIGQERPDEFITLFDYANDKRKDLTKKAIKYYDNDYDAAKEGRQINEYSVTATDALAPKGIVDEIRTTIVENLGSKNTTEQWADLRKQGFWGGAILGVTESIPAMIGGAGKIGSTQRAVQMIAQATDAIDDEMSRNPEFDNVSEKEKFYVKAPIGVAVGVLENIGFRNVINQKGLITNVLGKALGKSTSRTTAKQFGDFVREDVKSMMGRGLLTLTGAGLAEFETGAAQELATLSIKEMYNISKEKDMFQTPDTWIDWAADIAYAGAQEAVGGFILGVPNAVSNAVYTKDMSRVSDDMFKVFEAMSKDPEYKRMMEAKLNAKVLSGEMTREDADKEMAQINQVEGLLNDKIPNNLPTELKKKALELVAEKQELEREIENKEPELVKKTKDRIDKIKEELRGIEEKNDSLQQEAEIQAQEKLEAEKVGIGVVGDTQVTETAPVEETQEQKDIAQMFEGEIAEAQAVSDNLAINERGNVEERTTQDNSRIADVVNRAKRAATAISTVLPQTKIVLHESKDEFKRFTGKTGRGLFDPQTNTIHINLTDATSTTVPHEVFHAVLLNKIGTDTELQGVVKDMVMSVAKVVKKGTELSNKLDEFVAAYESEGDAIINEERLAELMALMSTDYGMLSKPQKNVVLDFIRKVASKFGIELGDTFGQKDSDVIDLLNTMARKTQVGEQITDADLEIFSTEQGEGGLVGTFTFPPREQVEVTEAPSVKDDPRRFVRDLVEDKDIREFEGQKFITNMYDYTTAGETDMGNGLMANFVGGINYAPYMMSRKGLSIGDMSNLAAFQGKDKAETFIRSVELSGVNLFAPHSGTLEKSWQFQQHIFAELSDLVLDNGIVTNEELINYFSGKLNSKAGKKAFATFQRNYEKKFGEKIDSLDRFKDNPKELISLLGIDDNMSLKMRQSFNDSLSALKPFQEAIGVGNKSEFYGKIIDPTNIGVTGGEIMGVIKFDPNVLSIRKTTPNDIDHHPSFSWTVDAKVEGFYQPTLFYKSYDLTDAYTKYNKDGSSISRKVEGETEEFIKGNVMSSAGAIPKVTEPLAVPEPTVRKAREQKSMNQIIQESRDAGFKEDVIRDLLVRRLGMKARVVDNALAKFTDLFREFGTMPKSFGDMDGGLVASKKLFKKLQAFHRKEVRNNKRRVERNRISQQEIMDKTIDYMESLPEFKAEGDTYVRGGKTITRQGYSTQQARMISDLQKMVNVRPTENVRQKVRDARRLIAEKKREKNQLKRIKYELRKLMRKTLPESLYTKKEALDLMQKIVDADTNTIDNIVEEVASFVISKNNQILKSKIDALLAKDTTKVEYGRRKGKRVSVRVKETIDLIKTNLLNDKSTSEEIDAKNAQLSVEFNKLSEIPNKTEEQMLKMTALKTAIEYNNALQMDNSDSSKTDTLDFILDTLQSLEDAGRSEFQAEIEEQQAMYQSDFAVAYEEIMQKTIDFSDPKAQEQLDETRRDLENEKAAKTVAQKVKKILSNISQNLRIGIFTSAEALDGLIDLISRSAGEMFGGKLQEIVTDSIDASSRMYKARKMYVESLVANKLEEIYGKKWQKATRKNNVAKSYVLGGRNIDLSQNQMYYLYNQYKDEANHAAFKNMYGDNYAQVMSDMEAALDQKVKEFADWQVNEFFPSLYDHYNSVYRKIYKTNMPQNEKYAGRIYRKDVEAEPLDLLGNKSVFNTAVGAASTKARVANNEMIEAMNGNDALFAYIKDMEYFAAYAENVRRIDKMFNNKYISSAIKSIHGAGTYTLIKDSIQKIANNGTRNPMLAKVVNSLNDVFILSRLALSPLITIKQFTSIPTYANDIGVLNWLKYSGMNLAKLRKTYKEVAENSVYMQDRKRTPITQAIEAYGNAPLSKRKSIIPSNVRDTIIKVMMYNVKVGDAAAIYIGGMPNYLYYKDQYKKSNPSATEQEAIDYAVVKFEKDTKRTQQSSDLQDKDYLQTNNPVLRAANMFMTTPKQYLRKEIQAMRNLYRKMKAFDRKAGKGTVTENLRTFAMYHFFMPMLFQYISMGLPGLLRGWREDDEKDLFRAAVLGNLNALFILGEIAQFISDAYAGKPYAGEQVKAAGILNQAQRMTRLYKRAEKTTDPEKREANFKKFYLESTMLTGLPAPTLKKFAENYSKIGEGDDIGRDIMRLLNYSEYQQVGSKKTKGKDPATIQELNEQYEKEQSKIRRQSKGLQNDGGYVSPSRRKSRGKSSGGYVPPSRRK